ncbi:MAG: DUF3883 domain-containing protein [Oscillospiraceae bacterium]|nr:DUF3883 domain-containing protein [Oscillospiraceae bacterium]
MTVSKNEILIALNKPDEYILAIVEVELDLGTRASSPHPDFSTKTIYLKKPFLERPDFAATSVNYDIVELVGGADVILKRG